MAAKSGITRRDIIVAVGATVIAGILIALMKGAKPMLVQAPGMIGPLMDAIIPNPELPVRELARSPRGPTNINVARSPSMSYPRANSCGCGSPRSGNYYLSGPTARIQDAMVSLYDSTSLEQYPKPDAQYARIDLVGNG